MLPLGDTRCDEEFYLYFLTEISAAGLPFWLTYLVIIIRYAGQWKDWHIVDRPRPSPTWVFLNSLS